MGHATSFMTNGSITPRTSMLRRLFGAGGWVLRKTPKSCATTKTGNIGPSTSMAEAFPLKCLATQEQMNTPAKSEGPSETSAPRGLFVPASKAKKDRTQQEG